MKKLLIASAATAAVLAATPAAAQDAATAPAGVRVEALLGLDHVKALGEDDNGVLFGLGAGYDFAVSSSMSLGLDAEISDSTQKIGDDDLNVKAGRDLYAGARFSYGIADNANLYLKAGYTNARFKAEVDGDDFGDNFDGFRVGAGAQGQISGKTYIGGEYRYSNYQDGLERHQVAVTVGTRF